jgi:SAM-dependent methyltransferase
MDWRTSLHEIRKREIELIFSGCPPCAFPAALELGAGDGYQSGLLEAYVDRLVVTDFDVTLILNRRSDRVHVRACDAEAVAEAFPAAEFDLVFSSNVFEHLPNPGLALRSIHRVLKDHGVTVHVMPNPFWKLCNFGLFFPFLIPRGLRYLARHLTLGNGESAIVLPNSPEILLPNNPKMPSNGTSWGRRLWPSPHGAYRGHLEELWAYRKARWVHELQRAGFRVVHVLKGPLSSGYGLGWERARHTLEYAGLTSEYVYVATKQGCRSPYEKYFAESY